MTKLIAERSVYGVVNAIELRIVIQIFAPEADDRGNWSCRYTFQTDGSTVVLKDGAGRGVDSIQALVSALHGVGHTLDKSGVEWSMFPESEDPGTNLLPRLDDGFPRAGLSPGLLGAAFRKRMELHVTNEREKALEALVASKRPSKTAIDTTMSVIENGHKPPQ